MQFKATVAWCCRHNSPHSGWGTESDGAPVAARGSGRMPPLQGAHRKANVEHYFHFSPFFIKVNTLFISIKWRLTLMKEKWHKVNFCKVEGTCNCLISMSYEILQAKLSCDVGCGKVSSGWKESQGPSGGPGLLDGCVYFENSSSCTLRTGAFLSMYDILE